MTAELAHDDDTLFVPRYPGPQVVKALALLAAKTDLWEARHQTGPLYAWLASRARGETLPPDLERACREFGDTVVDAAAVLRLGAPDMMP